MWAPLTPKFRACAPCSKGFSPKKNKHGRCRIRNRDQPMGTCMQPMGTCMKQFLVFDRHNASALKISPKSFIPHPPLCYPTPSGEKGWLYFTKLRPSPMPFTRFFITLPSSTRNPIRSARAPRQLCCLRSYSRVRARLASEVGFSRKNTVFRASHSVSAHPGCASAASAAALAAAWGLCCGRTGGGARARGSPGGTQSPKTNGGASFAPGGPRCAAPHRPFSRNPGDLFGTRPACGVDALRTSLLAPRRRLPRRTTGFSAPPMVPPRRVAVPRIRKAVVRVAAIRSRKAVVRAPSCCLHFARLKGVLRISSWKSRRTFSTLFVTPMRRSSQRRRPRWGARPRPRQAWPRRR